MGDFVLTVWVIGSFVSLIFVIRPVLSWPPVSQRWRAIVWFAVFITLPVSWTLVDPVGEKAWADAVEARHPHKAPPFAAAAPPTSDDPCGAPDPGDVYMHQHFPGYLSKHELCVLDREAAAQMRAHPQAQEGAPPQAEPQTNDVDN